MASSYDTPGSLNLRSHEYLDFRRSSGVAKGTLRNDLATLRRFMQVNGNLLLKSVDDSHVTRYLEVAGKTRSAASLGIDFQVLRGFFDWGRRTRRMALDQDPMAGRKAPKAMQKERRRVAVGQFPELLDAVPHPRDRICLALGLYLFLRASEITSLKIGRVGLQAGEILVDVHKSKLQDVMPICSELDEELRRWFSYYTKLTGASLAPDLYLVPARTKGRFARDPVTGLFTAERIVSEQLTPAKPVQQPEKIAQRALRGIGFLAEDVGGQQEGIHTLRRSGGRALFDALQQAEPYEDENGKVIHPPSYPIRQVQSMLHHANQATTERYIGLEPDRWERDRLLRGRVMFKVNRDNVIKMGEHDGGRRQEVAGV